MEHHTVLLVRIMFTPAAFPHTPGEDWPLGRGPEVAPTLPCKVLSEIRGRFGESWGNSVDEMFYSEKTVVGCEDGGS